MAKQTQSKDQTSGTDNVAEKKVQEVPNTEESGKDAFGDVQTPGTDKVADALQTEDSHNPYSKQNATESVKSIEPLEPAKVQEFAPHFDNAQATDVIQPTIQEPIKPTLTDQVVYEDFSKESTVKVQNENGVVVNLSGTAAKILKTLDATTKIVK